MIKKLRRRWQVMRSSFWFVPGVLVLNAVVLATLLISVDTTADLHPEIRWPMLFGAGAAGARGLLTTVATSMITVAGLVFSITLVALSQTSSQYTSRVVHNFMRDRVNQWVLGIFLGIFAYCLVVLRTMGGEEAFVPPVAVLAGMLLAFVGIAALIHFIHHIATSIQASSIIATAAQETLSAVGRLFPEELQEQEDEGADADLAIALASEDWSDVPATKTGYIESVDEDVLLEVARDLKTILRMEHGVGEFVVVGVPLVSLRDPRGLDAAAKDRLNAAFAISRQRTVEQDAAFGIRQIVDVAMKALSPGINDTTTAIMCVDYLGAILTQLSKRRIGTQQRFGPDDVCMILRGPSFESLLSEAFDQIRRDARSNVTVLLHLLGTLQTIAGLTNSPSRRRLLRQKAEEVAEVADRSIKSPYDRHRLASKLMQIRDVLDRGAAR